MPLARTVLCGLELVRDLYSIEVLPGILLSLHVMIDVGSV